MSKTDLLGSQLNELEQETWELYERLKGLAARPDAPPCVAANARFAVAILWQAVNDLGIEHEQLTDLGI